MHNLTLFPCWLGNSQLIYVNIYMSCLSPSISLYYVPFQQYFYIWREFWYTLVYLILAWAKDRLCKNNFRILLFLPVLPAPTFILLNVSAFWSCQLCLWVVHKFSFSGMLYPSTHLKGLLGSFGFRLIKILMPSAVLVWNCFC